jgi:hypothetical protein
MIGVKPQEENRLNYCALLDYYTIMLQLSFRKRLGIDISIEPCSDAEKNFLALAGLSFFKRMLFFCLTCDSIQ